MSFPTDDLAARRARHGRETRRLVSNGPPWDVCHACRRLWPCDAEVLGAAWAATEKEIAAAVPDLMLMAFRLGITTEEELTGQPDPPWRVVRQRLEAVLDAERQARQAAEAEVERLHAALATVSARQNRAELDLSLPSQPRPQWRAVAQALGDIARAALVEAQ